jgi:hypothetical protein
MIDILFQLVNGKLVPQSQEDSELLLGDFKANEMLRGKLTHVGAQKARSVPALNTLMACLQLLADNTDDPQYNSKLKAKFACKVAIDYRYEDRVAIRPDGLVVFEYRSFGFDSLGHMESLNVFERSFKWIAGIMGITVEELIAEAQSRMQRRW